VEVSKGFGGFLEITFLAEKRLRTKTLQTQTQAGSVRYAAARIQSGNMRVRWNRRTGVRAGVNRRDVDRVPGISEF